MIPKHAIFIFLFTLFGIDCALAQGFQLNSPHDSATFHSGVVDFNWRGPEPANYNFQIALDSNFTNLIKDTLLSNCELSLDLEEGQVYWRNILTATSDTSHFRKLTLIDINNLENKFFHFTADSGIIHTNNAVESWEGISSNNHIISQPDPDKRPLLIENYDELNSYNTLLFDGIDDFLSNNLFDLDQPCNYFLILKENQLAGNYMDGSNGIAKHLLRFQGGKYGFTSGSGSVKSTTDIDTTVYAIINIELSEEVGSFYLNGVFEALNNTGSRTSEGLTLAAFGTGNGNMDMFLPEIIALDTTIQDTMRANITNYLFDKYAPPLDLGKDIYSTNFCDIVLTTGSRLTSVNWSDGSSLDSLVVNESGTYYASGIDIFGRTTSDTIYIELLDVNQITSDSLCIGESLDWNTELDNLNYDFNWSDGGTDSLLTIVDANDYWVEIQDSFGCSYFSDTISIYSDEFEITATLGPDQDLCAGNALSLISGASDAINYTWNDNSNGSELIVNSSGTYWVEVENSNGCMAQDSIDINIIGQAPTASFIAANFCIGDQVDFTDLSFPPTGESIQTWEWNFGDMNSSIDQNPSHLYDTIGNFLVGLTVETPAGCTDEFQTEIQINPLPEVDFTTSNLCSDQNAFFDDASSITSGFLNSWNWEFGDSQGASGQNVGHNYSEPGTYTVTLTTGSAVNCFSSSSATININPSPISSFNASSTCLGQATAFSQNVDTTIAGPVQNYAWNFGNGFTSNFPITSQTYFVPGSYNVSLSVTSLLGCTDDTIQIVNINDLPNAGFSNIVACIDEQTLFTDTTNIFLNDSIVFWNWNFANQGASNTANPEFVFNTVGNFNVSLQVESAAGCLGEAQSIVNVFEDPNPEFQFDPTIGLPPLDVSFDNLTPDAENYVWNFGNGDSSIDVSPEYTYLDTGIFTIQLSAFNENGCSESIEKTILVIEPIFELEMNELFCTIDDGRLIAQTLISNFGNHDINNFEISLEIGNGARLIENWNGLLRPGESMLYDFVAHPEYNPIINQAFFCSEVSNPNGNNREVTLDNNSMCKALEASEFVLYPPFPNPNQGELNFNFILPDDQSVIIDIIDDRGRTVRKREFDGQEGHNNYQLYLPNLEVGSYLLRVSNNLNTEVQWFFIE